MRTRLLIALLTSFAPAILAAADLLSLAAEGFKHEELRQALRELPASIDDIRDDSGKTALHRSIQRGQFEDVLLLLLAGAGTNAVDASGRTPLFYALEHRGENGMLLLELLTHDGADVNLMAEDGSTPLAMAVQAGHTEAIQFLLRRGAVLELARVPEEMRPSAIARSSGDAALMALLEPASLPPPLKNSAARQRDDARQRRFIAAARAADLSAVTALLAEGAEVNERDADGATALYRAVNDHRADLVSLLLLAGADPNLATNAGLTPLMAATPFFDMPGTRATMLLLLAGADVKAVTKDGRTALSEAVAKSNNFAVKWCIWQGASLEVTTPMGTLMQLAKARAGWPSMIALLKSYGVSDDAPLAKPPEQALFDAVRAKDRAAVEKELAGGISASVVDERGCSPLAWAAHYGAFEIVDLLIAHGADVNQPNAKTSKTVLHELALWGRGSGDARVAAEHMEQLLARGAKPDLLTKDGMTALMIAARTGTAGENLVLLLRVTSDVNVRSKAGKTALGLAREFGHGEVAEQLIAKGARE